VPRDPTTFVPPRQVLVPSTRDSQNNKNYSIYMPYCVDKSLLRLRTVASLAHVIQALVQSQLQKHTSHPIQTKYPSISSIFVLAQSFGNSFAQHRQSYAFAAARPVLQATNASFKYSCIQASKFDLLLVCTRLVSKRRYSTRIRLRRGSRRVREKEGMPL